ncbi:hypothetical protein HDV63DRAFT_379753 [Trichoderma sp. SZMC 28014]
MRSPPEPRRGRGRPAKNPDSTAANSKSTKIVTAAAKARSAVPSNLTANTKSTAAKRKARTDDAEEEQQATLAKRPRGRPPKKPVEEQDNGAAKSVGAASAMASTGASRAKVTAKKGMSETAKEEPTAPKPTRGRPRKVVSKPEESDNQPEPPKKATRGRPPTVMKSATTTTTGANKPPVKKVVKFREPDKENVEPAASPPEPAPTGMRGRPARRGGAAAARTTTRPAAKPSKPQAGSKKPLSPKKITQLTLTQYDSEDELSLEKPLTKSPIKPPSKTSEVAPIEIEPEMTTVAVNTAMFDLPELNATLFGSPARRPTSPPRDTIKSPAKRVAMPLPGSALKLSNESVAQTPFKPSSTLLQSAAKRPQSPMKPFIFSAQKQPPNESKSTTKPSMLQSPAKRAFPGFKSLSDSRRPDLPTLDESPIATPSRPAKSSQNFLIEEDDYEDEEDDPFAIPIIDLRFSRSPSTVPFRQADLVSTEEEAGEEAEEEVEAEVEHEAEADYEEEAGAGDEVQEENENENEAQEEADEAEADVDREATAEAEVEVLELENEEEGSEEAEEEELQTAAVPETLEAEEDAGDETEEEPEDAAEESIIVATEESNDVPTETEDANEDEEENEGQDGGEDEDEDDSEDTMVLDDQATEEEEEEEGAGSSPKVDTPAADTLYQLREKDLDPCHDMSSIAEDADDTLPFERLAATPSILEETTPRTRASAMKGSRRSTLGFSSLSDQLGSWSAASPVKHAVSFADEPELSYADDDEEVEDEIAESIDDQDLEEETMIMDEDTALAQETNEMTLSDPMEGEDGSNTRQSFDDSLSDASQEYGDENQNPIESPVPVPQPPQPRVAAPVTPISRPMTRSFNTTTKIPTKPADNSTPSPLKKKSFSASRAAPKRPDQPKRGASALSFSPKKQQQPLRRSSRNISTISEEPDQRIEPSTPAAEAEKASKVETPEQMMEPSTPESKADLWAKIGTPARTPHKDLNSNLLRGAIVFVDVHTSEGADASSIFVELLTQMGARCLQKWSWNPNNASNSESTKVGITHVVFKDGSKRTLEKVRQANGVVQCVGVSWVLDCERDNKWLDELPYHIDTSYVPRGGARRRKSMEPKTVSNQNGSAVSGSPKGRRESAPPASSSPKTPNRRQSSIWIHTPSDTSEEHEEKEEEDIEWSNMILTPVPKTPAPEALMKFATETPSNLEDDDEYEDDESPSLRREELMTRTCPPKAQRFMELGGGILSRDSDDNVLARLMAARRKSLQFAPKVGSPLAKMWQ